MNADQTGRPRLERLPTGILGLDTILRGGFLRGSVAGLPLSGLSLEGVSCIAEIILVTRYVELRSQLHRMISVLKVRDAEVNSALHEFTIGQSGIVIAPDSSSAENILTEAARQGRDLGSARLTERPR